jgi:hypothetical protein
LSESERASERERERERASERARERKPEFQSDTNGIHDISCIQTYTPTPHTPPHLTYTQAMDIVDTTALASLIQLVEEIEGHNIPVC